MAIRVIRTEKCVAPVGPYSQGLVANGTVYAAGQLGLDPATSQLVPGGIVAETRQALSNVQSVLAEAGCSMDDVVSSNVYMVNLAEFAAMNQVYAEFFKRNPPARTTVGVAGLPKGAAVEITCIAVLPNRQS
jgi:2-iminobutanoate/2-iminopropanoate deaminase